MVGSSVPFVLFIENDSILFPGLNSTLKVQAPLILGLLFSW